MSQISLTIAEKIEDYEILDLLGKGGFACVYRAKCLKSGFEVALKMIDKKIMQNSGMVGRVKQEVAIHSKLKHPSILELYTFFEDANYVYLVLELAQNGELHRYLKESQRVLTETETANILMQVVNGLLYLKVNNILHRDMSLSNLLLTNDLKVKIADFGLATQLSRPDEKHTTLCGTPNYISPEVASRATHGLPVDVWGLGCMMYTLLVGKPPFDTDGVKSTLTRVVMADFVVPNSLSIEAKDLLNRLLRKNPNERIHIEDVLTHPFMLKHLAASHPTYSNTVGSVDSGLLTMSSGMTSAQNLTGKMDMRLRSDEHNFSQTKMPVKATNVFDNIRVGHSASSLYNRYDSQYNDFVHQPSHQSQSNELVDRIGNLGLMQPQEDKQLFGSAGIGGSCGAYSSKPNFGNLHTPSDILANHTPMPLQENRFYGMQQNLVAPHQTHNLNFEPMLSKQHPTKVKSSQKLSVPPLNSERLLPTRFKTKTAILSISSLGEVVVELIKYKEKYNEERVVDVCRISKDGLRIVVYQPDAGRGLKIQDSPPDLPESGADSIYSYENLPSKHQKKYVYASRFIQLVRAKTPKITYYSSKGKCDLMENLENFELSFYDGEKIVRTSENNVNIFDNDGNVLASNNENDTIRALWLHYQQCFEHCKTLERILNSINVEGECFPIIVGRRPATAPVLGVSRCNSNNLLTPRLASASSLMSLNSVTSTKTSQMKSSPIFHSTPTEKKVIVPGIGIASQSPEGVVEVLYQDGSRLALHTPEQGGGITFTQMNGSTCHYNASNDDYSIPEIVRNRLNQMEIVVKYLMAHNSSHVPLCTPVSNKCMQQQMKFFR
ncbi:serine/threonine-protein kinase PLK4 [Contarinia nasturtii]|uniref:serine/threonine-protein kinase PLK4 n=1 Tax=Contarinia nasturtii TaxID=265458 RepID=UPI0012D42A15|nr:serine/threonine-protein kinase PLK4 [Contarinia nasturtii]